MKKLILATFVLPLVCLAILSAKYKKQESPPSTTQTAPYLQPVIQVAVLLDVSNSMDGLIEQAKAQLWNMVALLGKATCDGVTPQIEIALYEYGRSSNNPRDGFVKQLSPFTKDLDGFSHTLFGLVTNGGDEFCGHVIYQSLTDLKWDTSASNYKVIFIAGNEDFLQGDVLWTKACAAASKKNVVVNTIYCGERLQGINEHWNLAGECGNGSFTNINKDAKTEDIPTPYDNLLFSLNTQLNKTYIPYGKAGNGKLAQQAEVDKLNYSMNKSVAIERVGVKGKKDLYKNTNWDLVDAFEQDNQVISKIDIQLLPDSLQKKTRPEITGIVRQKNIEREKIQQDIAATHQKRELFLTAQKNKTAANPGNATLETAIEKTIKLQAGRYRFKFK